LKKSTQPAQNIKSQVEWCTTKTERQKKRREAQQSSRQFRRSRKMADVENGIHDSLVATAEPDEEAKRAVAASASWASWFSSSAW
jgi:hypothetical protein